LNEGLTSSDFNKPGKPGFRLLFLDSMKFHHLPQDFQIVSVFGRRFLAFALIQWSYVDIMGIIKMTEFNLTCKGVLSILRSLKSMLLSILSTGSNAHFNNGEYNDKKDCH